MSTSTYTTSAPLLEAAATFGRVYSVIAPMIGVIIAINCIFLGVSKLHDPHTSTATATVTKATSRVTSSQNGATSYTYVVDATYPVGGHKYRATGLTVEQSSPLQVGSTLTPHYDPSNPQSGVYEQSPRGGGLGPHRLRPPPGRDHHGNCRDDLQVPGLRGRLRHGRGREHDRPLVLGRPPRRPGWGRPRAPPPFFAARRLNLKQ